MIEATGIYKSYNGAVNVLKDVCLNVSKGEFVAVLGASGSGKTTLMSVLSGLERPDEGKVVCCGEDLTAMDDSNLTDFRRRKVGFIFQQYYLLPHLSVEKNVKLGADLIKNSDYRQIIEAVGLKNKLKKRPFELSGGEQQRVCIARAIAKLPEILFLDEPTGALDEETGRQVLDYILKIRAERAFTMVMVTHNTNIAKTADSVVHMNSGKIIKKTVNSRPLTAYEIGW